MIGARTILDVYETLISGAVEDHYQTATEACRYFGISPRTLKSWCDMGCPYVGGDSTHRRYKIKLIEAWLITRQQNSTTRTADAQD